MHSEGYGTQFVCVSVTSLTATPLTYRYMYKGRYESKVNVVLKIFDSWISLKILRSKVMALFARHNKLLRFRQPVDTSGDTLMTTEDYW